MRVLCHAQHLTGVGHFVIAHNIARGLAKGHDVYLVKGGRPATDTHTGEQVEMAVVAE